MARPGRVTAILAVLLLGCGSEEPSRPDVVVIMIDTLRPDHLDLHGYPHETAPYLRQLAEQGVVFEDARSTSSWTAPSTASLFSGLYPIRHGVTRGLHARGRPQSDGSHERLELTAIGRDLRTMPELFQDAGYHTFGVAANINIGDKLGFDRGFDHFALKHRGDARELADTIRPWLSGPPDPTPRFVYLHFNDVHVPYNRRDPWYRDPALEGIQVRTSQADAIQRYDSEISYLDDTLAKLDELLIRRDDTIVMVVSDHGEEFHEHGQTGHQFTLYDELNRVLMMVKAPGQAEPGRRSTARVSLIDVLPTVLDLAGLDATVADGQSLTPLLQSASATRHEDQLDRRVLFAHRVQVPEEKWAVVIGSWKLIETHGDGEPRRELYHLATDPGEQDDVGARHPDVVQNLSEELDRFRRTATPATESVSITVDEDLWDHLNELGYTGDDGP